MTAGLTVKIFLVFVVLIGFINFLTGVEAWWFRRKSSGSHSGGGGGGRSYGIYACPLDLFGKKCRKRGWIHAPYGIKHTYLRIGNTCYDWGNWNYVRHVDCSDDEISCCVDDAKKKYSGSTKCASRVGEFESAWRRTGKSYHLLSWNCQRYVDAMKDFLNNCYSSASSAIP